MSRTETATRAGMTLELEPDPVHAPTVVERTPAAGDQKQADRLAELQDRSPIDKILYLRTMGVSLDEIDRFLEMQAKWEAREAKKAFDRAMAAFKREELPTILKDHHVHYDTNGGGAVDYWHEELFSVVNSVVPAMAKHGLTHKWDPQQENPTAMIRVYCILTHEAGHSESIWLPAAPDTSGKKNAIQAVKSTISYLERILLLASTGTAAKGMDDDGRMGRPNGEPPGGAPEPKTGKPATAAPQARSAGPAPEGFGGSAPPSGPRNDKTITSKQIKLIGDRLSESGLRERDLLDHFKVGTVSEIRMNDCDAALAWIKNASR